MNARDLYLLYLGGQLSLSDFQTQLTNLVKASNKTLPDAQVVALAKQEAGKLVATPLSKQEDNIVQNYRQQVIANEKANGALANPNPEFPDYKTEAQMSGPSAATLLDAFQANPNGSTTYQDVVNAYKTQQGLNDAQARALVDSALASKTKGLDVNQSAAQLVPGAGALPKDTTASDIAQAVTQGQATLEQAYNTFLLQGKTPDYAINYLRTNAKAPASWQPNISTPPETAVGMTESLAGPSNAAPPATYAGPHADFYDTFGPAAAYAQQKYGLDPSIVLAINASESNWGNAPGYMGFGIKGTGAAGSANLATHEVVNGQNVNVNDNFRQYTSPQQAVDDFMNFLQSNSRYASALANFQKSGDTAQLIRDINKAGYATDPHWADSILSLAQTTGKAIGEGAGAGAAGAGGASLEAQSVLEAGGRFVTNADGTTSFVPLTALEKKQLQTQISQQAKVSGENDAKAAIADFVLQNPGAKVFNLGKPGQYKVEMPDGTTFNGAYDQSTGQLQWAYTGMNPAVSAQGLQGTFGGSDVSKTLLETDPTLRNQYERLTFGRPLNPAEEQALFGSVGSNGSQDYADLQAARQTMADTGKLPNQFDARNQTSAMTQALRAGSGAAPATQQLTPQEAALYGLDPNIYRGTPDYTRQVGQDQVGGYSLLPVSTNDTQSAQRVANEVRAGALSNTQGMNLSLADERTIGQLNNVADQNQGSGQVTDQADYQSGYAAGKAAHDAAMASGGVTDVPNPSGSPGYVAGFKQAWREAESQRASMVGVLPETATSTNTGKYGSLTYQPTVFNENATRAYGGGNNVSVTGVPVARENAPVSNFAPAPLPGPGDYFTGPFVPPVAPEPPPVVTPPPPPPLIKQPSPVIYQPLITAA